MIYKETEKVQSQIANILDDLAESVTDNLNPPIKGKITREKLVARGIERFDVNLNLNETVHWVTEKGVAITDYVKISRTEKAIEVSRTKEMPEGLSIMQDKNVNSALIGKSDDLKEIVWKINHKLSTNPLLCPAIKLAQLSSEKYRKIDWYDYEKETGNPRIDAINRNGLDAWNNRPKGCEEEQELARAKFLLWNIIEFEKGMNS